MIQWMTKISTAQMGAWRSFLELHARVIRVLETELHRAEGLPLSWYDVLVQLNEAGGRMRMGELADRILISRSATTRFVERLEKAGLIVREACATDRRGTFVVLTDNGKGVLRDAAPTHLAGVEEHFTRHLSGTEARQLSATLERLLQLQTSHEDQPN